MRYFSLFILISIAFFLFIISIDIDSRTSIACIGDSNTIGHGLFPKSLLSYPSQLRFILGSKYLIENFGLSGSTVSGNKDSMYKNSITFIESKKKNYKYFIFMLGTNDSKQLNDEFYDRYNELISSYQITDSRCVLILTPPKAFSSKFGVNDLLISKIIRNEVIKTAKTNNYTLIDTYELLSKRSYFQNDGIHLNIEGANLLANKIEEIIKNDI